jgi:hypothetical protein
MRKILFPILASLAVLSFSACYKDIGNYSYHSINEVSFQNIDTIKGYSAYFGDTLTISPTVVSSANDTSENDYTYEWSFRLGVAQTATNPLRDSVVSTQRALAVKIALTPGNYTLQYRVTDKKTGVQFHAMTNLLVTTQVYEGFLVMNDVNGAARLDMLSYNSTSNVFTQYTDVLQKMGSTVPMQGQPYQVLCMLYTRSNITTQDYGIFLLTSGSTNRVDQETFAWDPTYNIRYLMVGDVPQTFTAQQLTGQYNGTNSTPTIFMYGSDGNLYSYSTSAGYAFRYAPLNTYTASGTPFKTTPYVATDGNMAVFYDAGNRNFVTVANPSAPVASLVNPTLNYPTGYDLVWMNCNYYPEGGQVKTTYAILKDPATSRYYMLTFVLGAAQSYFQQIMDPNIAGAANFTVSPTFGYLFYNIGSKVYEYDLSLQQTFLMLDKGNAQVSYLSFLHIYDRYGLAQTTKNANYFNWSTLLTVGSYDPSGTPGTNGTLEQYTVAPVNGQIVQAAKWTGFGKIVSVGYRSR